MAEQIMVEGHGVHQKAADPWHGVCAEDVEQRLAKEHPAVWAGMRKFQADRHLAEEQATVASVPFTPAPVSISNAGNTNCMEYHNCLHSKSHPAARQCEPISSICCRLEAVCTV